jgi:flagellar hook assembly protein FlgD
MDKAKKLFVLGLMLMLMVTASYARGNKEPPTISETSGPHYFNPAGSAEQNTATLEFQVKLYVKSEEGYIPESNLTIVDDAGNTVREVRQKGKRDIGFFAAIFADYKEFEQKGTISWDGKDEQGNIVPDGEYSVALRVEAASNREKIVDLGKVFVVDTSAPETTVSVDLSLFSPNGDGNQDTVTFSQSLKDSGGSPISSWTGTVADSAGDSQRTFSGTDKNPEAVTWDGKSDAGMLLDDGTFTYQLVVIDKAGNSWQSSAFSIELDARTTPVWIDIDNPYFSPNGDGLKETATLSVGADVTDGVKSWVLSVVDGAGASRWQKTGSATVPSEDFVFDGKDQSGSVLADAAYTVAFNVEYDKGDKVSDSTTLTVDTVDPVVKPTVSNPAFSPNGDNRKDTTEIDMGVPSEPITWMGKITDTGGTVLLETSSDETTKLIVWDGKDSSGRTVADGTYTLEALFRDRADNPASYKANITVDTVAPVVDASIDKTVFSPDGDGYKDTFTATVSASEPVEGRVMVKDPFARDVLVLPFSDIVSESIEIAAADTTDLSLVDGTYTIIAEFWDPAGNTVPEKTFQLKRDTRPTTIVLAAPEAFSPNNDGEQDTVSISIDASVRDGLESWDAKIQDATGRSVYTFDPAAAVPSVLVWDGTAGTAAAAPEGGYRLAVNAVYEKGNRVSVSSDLIYLDVTPPTVTLTMTADPFAQTDEGIEGQAFITLKVVDESSIARWEMDILDRYSEVIRSYMGSGDPSDMIAWNGQAESGTPVPEPTDFTLQVNVTDAAGNSRMFKQPMPIDILVLKKDGKLYLMVPNIIFGAYQHALDSYSTEMYERNVATIKRVAEIYRNYPAHGVLLEGHALNIYRGDPAEEAREEKILVPLTQRRAETVRQALLNLGIEGGRIAMEWFGGTQPIADVHDEEIRWKNRRVEFIMTKPE